MVILIMPTRSCECDNDDDGDFNSKLMMIMVMVMVIMPTRSCDDDDGHEEGDVIIVIFKIMTMLVKMLFNVHPSTGWNTELSRYVTGHHYFQGREHSEDNSLDDDDHQGYDDDDNDDDDDDDYLVEPHVYCRHSPVKLS